MSATARCRQNYSSDSEAEVNKQINLELYASYVYLSMVRKTLIWKASKFVQFTNCPLLQAYHFDRDDVALPGFFKYFKKASDEERQHAEKVSLNLILSCRQVLVIVYATMKFENFVVHFIFM